jgi:hypothetical protein
MGLMDRAKPVSRSSGSIAAGQPGRTSTLEPDARGLDLTSRSGTACSASGVPRTAPMTECGERNSDTLGEGSVVTAVSSP